MEHLKNNERSPATVEKYMAAAEEFMLYLDGGEVTKEAVSNWKDMLVRSGAAPSTINCKLTVIYKFLEFMGWGT